MDYSIIITNFTYATIGAVIAILFMMIGYKIFDKMTPFNTAKELGQGNRAVGTVIGSIFLGVGIAVGLVIGLGLN